VTLFRLLARLLPAWFRRTYTTRLEAAYEDDLGRATSGVARAVVRIRSLADLVRTAVRLRLRPPPDTGGGPPHGNGAPPYGNEEDGMMTGGMHDLRMALRSLRRSPGFTSAAIATLALALGANTAIFGVLNAVVLAPLPYADEDELVMVWSRWNAFPKTWVSQEEFQTYTRANRTLADLAAFTGSSATFTEPENPERVQASGVTVSLFRTLGVEPILGRAFTEDEMVADAEVMLIGHRLWKRRFGEDPGVVGRTAEVGGVATEIVGVLPAGFRLPTDYDGATETEVFLPFHIDVSEDVIVPPNGGGHGLYVVGRIAPTATPDDAQADLSGIVERLAADGVYPPSMGFQVRVIPVRDDVLGTTRAALWVLLAAVGLVLLIACGNVANLLLARARVRGRETAVRAALGAGRGRLARQALFEGGVLALAGALVGLSLAALGVRAVLALDPGSVPRADMVRLDGTVLAFTFVVAALTVLVFGLMPALRTGSRADLNGLLREGGRETGRDGHRVQGLLVAGQTALAVTLLVGAGLMLRTFANLTAIDPGFETANALTMRLTLPAGAYPDVATSTVFYDQVLDEVRALPDVQAAAFVRSLPLASQIGDWGLAIEGYEAAPGESTPGDWQVVTAGYFEALGIEVVRGRLFDAADDVNSDDLVINEAMARRYWQGRDPLGTRVVAMGDTTVVVGIVADLAHNGITAEIKPKFYRLQRQIPDGLANTQRFMTLVVRTRGDPYGALEAVRVVVRGADPTLAVSQVQTLDEVLARTVGQPKLVMTLLGVFAGVALLLAVIGVYGVLTYTVNARTREIGVRMALGAERGSVVRMIVRQGLAMTGAGLVVGLGAALALSTGLESLLYGVPARDASTFAAVAGLFAAVALAAAWLPARRAAATDPVRALAGQ
jgi:predicted permease